ncbi:MAG: hypothetical protein ACT4NL_12885 [Pseudomarimonas sp.]
MIRPSIPFVRLALAAAIALGAGTAASAADTRLSLLPATAGELPQIEINGAWTSGCPPLLDGVEVVGKQITVSAKTDSNRCAAEPGPYQIRAEVPAGSKSFAAGETVRLRFELRDDPLNAPRLVAFELASIGVAAATEAAAIDPETGFWWGEPGGEFDHAGPGIGAQIERQGNTLAVSFSGYGESGQPEWMFGAAGFSGRSSDIALTRLEGGRGPFGGYVGPANAAAVGRLQIEWLTSARAVFWFSRTDAEGQGIDLQPISMVRFDFGQHPGSSWIGHWRLESAASGKSIELEFVDILVDDNGFTLISKAGESLTCEAAMNRPQSPPDVCEFEHSDGRLWRFEDVGLARLQGSDEQGGVLRAMQLPR